MQHSVKLCWVFDGGICNNMYLYIVDGTLGMIGFWPGDDHLPRVVDAFKRQREGTLLKNNKRNQSDQD